MTNVLLGILVVETGCLVTGLGVLVYQVRREFSDSGVYRDWHKGRRDDELDVALLNSVRLDRLVKPILASARNEHEHNGDDGGADPVTHLSSFRDES